ncbi:hypothetical protein ACFYY3_01075 [Streptomyces sp. NPDC001812]|uniref:hypothetical protein n=1 Tax=Streptomyces sp. NPDC001812 TaxID=3364611 RepID=UPI003675F086
MSDASSAELIAAALASVEDRIQQQIEAARQRREREKKQRAELAAARKAGLARRHAQRLHQQANRGETPTTMIPSQPVKGAGEGPVTTQDARRRAGMHEENSMTDQQTSPRESGPRPVPFEGRDELDKAWQAYRKALRGLLREGHRSDAETLAKVPVIAAEATETLLRLASDANAAAAGSERNRKARAEQEAALRRPLRKLVRQGSPAAARMLRQLDGGGSDDAA